MQYFLNTHAVTAIAFFATAMAAEAESNYCKPVGDPIHKKLCECQQIDSAVVRLDCFDILVKELDIERSAALGAAKALSERRHGNEAMRQVLGLPPAE